MQQGCKWQRNGFYSGK